MTSSPYVTVEEAAGATAAPGRSAVLRQFTIELTERCNNDCIHCYINRPAGDAEAKARELDAAELKGALDAAAELGCMDVRFTGGEPLLRDDFEELYLHTRRLGMQVELYTNATLISPRLADLFARIPPRQKIHVSLYGMTAQTYRAVARNPQTFHQAWSGVALLLERAIPVVVRGALLPPTRGEIAAFKAWAEGVPGMGAAPAYAMFYDLRARRDSPEKDRLIRGLRPSVADMLRASRESDPSHEAHVREYCAGAGGSPGDRLFGCAAGHGMACLDAYGVVQPCSLLRDPSTAYPLTGGTLAEAMREFFPRVRMRRAVNPAYLARCARCFLKSLCEQCPAKSWGENGTLDTPVEYLCDVAHGEAVAAGILCEGEKAWTVTNWQERVAAAEADAARAT